MKMNNETKIGIMVFFVLIGLAFLTLKSGDFNLSKKGYHIKAHFRNIDGVNMNSPVMINGFEVGLVEDINIIDVEDEVKVELTIWLKNSALLRQGTKAYVKNLGFMGEKYVGLTSGDKGGAVIKDGDLIIGQEPANFDKLVE